MPFLCHKCSPTSMPLMPFSYFCVGYMITSLLRSSCHHKKQLWQESEDKAHLHDGCSSDPLWTEPHGLLAAQSFQCPFWIPTCKPWVSCQGVPWLGQVTVRQRPSPAALSCEEHSWAGDGNRAHHVLLPCVSAYRSEFNPGFPKPLGEHKLL